MEFIAAIVLGLLLVSLFGFAHQKKRRKIKPTAASPVSADEISDILEQKTFSKIVIGEDPSFPVMTIEPSHALAEYSNGAPLDIHSRSISRLSALMQALPSLVLANEAAGKNLMEVVINGDLVRAADGNGLRAFAMGKNGIKEHARLFEADKLGNLVNAAALWQVASVVVAQKHLADISAKLDEIKNVVVGISRFLGDQRKSRIEATYDYLCQAHRSLQGGELSTSVQTHLEHCERDLIEIQRHLEKEYRALSEKRVEHKEFMGTKDLTKDIADKIQSLDELRRDAELCAKTRILAWHVLSLYPGAPALKQARRESIEQSIASFLSLGSIASGRLDEEISNISSRVEREATLQKRRSELKSQSTAALKSVDAGAQAGAIALADSARNLIALDRPTTVLFEFSGRELVGAREIGARP